MADKDLIEQVLINLIKNARENDATDIRISAGLSSGERPYIKDRRQRDRNRARGARPHLYPVLHD